jgi:CPA2 family monovalent cation:H+ antiporter-2
MLYSEGLTRGLNNRSRLADSLHLAFRLAGFIILSAWLLLLLPWSRGTAISFIVWILFLLLFILIFQRRLIRWHSRFELMLDESVSPSTGGHASWSQLRHPVEELNLDLVEVEVPDETPHAGRSIAQLNMRKTLGATIAGIERQGCLISAPGPDQQIYPNDRVLMLGTAEAIKAARSFLQNKSMHASHVSDFHEIGLEQLPLTEGSPLLKKTLMELNLSRDFSLTIVGIRRNNQVRLNLEAGDTLMIDDELLVLASPGNFIKLRDYALGRASSGPENEIDGTQHA